MNEENYVRKFLSLAGADRFNFFSNEAFMAIVDSFYENINEVGVEQTLATTKTLTTESF